MIFNRAQLLNSILLVLYSRNLNVKVLSIYRDILYSIKSRYNRQLTSYELSLKSREVRLFIKFAYVLTFESSF